MVLDGRRLCVRVLRPIRADGHADGGLRRPLSPGPRPDKAGRDTAVGAVLARPRDRAGGAPPSSAAAHLVATRGPNYPASGMVAGVAGSVRVKVTVDPHGAVRRAVVARTSGDKRLDAAAVRAAMGWRYQPARRNGRPIAAVDQAQF